MNSTTESSNKPQMQDEPIPPFPPQHQDSVGLESRLEPRPRFEARRYKAAGKLEGKVALITGGDSGIGRAVAVIYAREGADVAIAYLPEEQSDAEETRRHVQAAGRRCELLPGDLTDAAYCDDLVEQDRGERSGNWTSWCRTRRIRTASKRSRRSPTKSSIGPSRSTSTPISGSRGRRCAT